MSAEPPPAAPERSGSPPAGGTAPVAATLPATTAAPDGGPSELPEIPGYVVSMELAHGGMGRVLAATDRTLDRDVAVKVLLPPKPDDGASARAAYRAAAAARFVRESKITARLQHPGIPPVHQLGVLADGSPFLAMKLIRGRTLAALLKERASPADGLPRFVQAFEQICQAVGYAHEQGVIHRDLKPANVMVGAFGEVQVMDWGLAKAVRAAGEGPPLPPAPPPEAVDRTLSPDEVCRPEPGDSAGLICAPESEPPAAGGGSTPWEVDATRPGDVFGTFPFMPPEQARGEVDRVDARSDVFALGAVLCNILTGQLLYRGQGRELWRRAADWDTADAFLRLDGCGADPELVAVCKGCLAADPAARPADGGAVAKLVADYRAGVEARLRAAEADRAAAVARLAEQRKKRRVQLGLAAAVGVILLGTGAVGWWWDRTTTARRVDAENRERADEARKDRQRAAAADQVVQTEEALRAGDAARAGIALGAAESQVADADADAGDLAGRLVRCRVELTLLRKLGASDRFRWTPVVSPRPDRTGVAERYRLPDREAVIEQWRTAFAAAGLDPRSVPPADVARRVAGSPLRARLVATLDLWLVTAPSADVREVLRAADPDEYRDAVRDAVAGRDEPRVVALAGDPRALTQPPGFAAAVGQNEAVPVTRRRAVLRAALGSTPGDLSLLMTLGNTYPLTDKAGAAERVRWYQAAVAAAPTSVSARLNLGNALAAGQDLGGAVDAHREAVRLDPGYALAHYNLGVSLKDGGDLFGAVSSYREAVRLEPEFALAHNNLGEALYANGDVDGAVSSYREATRLDPGLALAHYNLGIALKARGDVDGAITCYREAIRLNPMLAEAHTNLGIALVFNGKPNEAMAHFEEAVRLHPDDPIYKKNLDVARRQKAERDAKSRPTTPTGAGREAAVGGVSGRRDP